MIDGEEYIISAVRICRKCKIELPPNMVNVEEHIDTDNRIILWQHKDCTRKTPKFAE